MGMDCPECGRRSAVIASITADGLGARKATDVIAYRLECGHTVGGERYDEFMRRAQELRLEARDAVRGIEISLQEKIAALWKVMSIEGMEGDDDAE